MRSLKILTDSGRVIMSLPDGVATCGAIVDPVIAAHKRITSSVVVSIQALTTEHEALSSWTDRLADHLTVQKRRVCHD
jgi:hypothetical protein